MIIVFDTSFRCGTKLVSHTAPSSNEIQQDILGFLSRNVLNYSSYIQPEAHLPDSVGFNVVINLYLPFGHCLVNALQVEYSLNSSGYSGSKSLEYTVVFYYLTVDGLCVIRLQLQF